MRSNKVYHWLLILALISFMIIATNSAFAAIYGPGTPENPMIFFEDFEGEEGNSEGNGIDGSKARYFSGVYGTQMEFFRVKLPSVTQNARYLITAYGKSTSNPPAKIGIQFVNFTRGTSNAYYSVLWNKEVTTSYKKLGYGTVGIASKIVNEHDEVGLRFVFLNEDGHEANFYLDNLMIERLYPGAPQNLSAIRNDEGIVTLSWDEAKMPPITVSAAPPGNLNTAFVASYNIYASTTPGLTRDSEKIASVDHIEGQENYSLTLEGDSFSTTFAGRYYFVVTAVDTDGWEGVVSNEVSVEPAGSVNIVVREKNAPTTPIEEATVILKSYDDDDFNRQLVTDSAGKVSFKNIPVGNYYVQVQKRNYTKALSQLITISEENLNHEDVIIELELDFIPTEKPKDIAG